jgi:hypothetical protein
MRDPESFDAFYARTVANVTSQMHALANGDPQADHAIREAYARAYQQWYEVSGYRDPENWVLDIAREAFERRRSQPAGATKAPDTGTWPGMYRPRTEPAPTAREPDATMASPDGGGPALQYQDPYYQSPTGYRPPASQPTGALDAGPAAGPRTWTTARPPAWPPRAGGSRQLIAIVAVVALLAVGGIAYLAFGRGQTGSPSADSGHKVTAGKTGPHMLPAGKTGSLAAVPWQLVRSGWTLADFSTAQPSASGQLTGGSTTTYLVDPEGGKYVVYAWPAGTNPTLLAWSGDADSALFGGNGGYQLLTLHGQPGSGQVAPLDLPAGVVPAGFTRPDGTNILAVRQGPLYNKLQRFDLQGQLQPPGTLADMPRRPVQGTLQGSCASSVCGALSSPTGIYAVWGLRGDEMQLVSNRGGIIRRLHVPGSGNPPSCTPVSWWNASTVLADCSAPGPETLELRLWLVPVNGGTATPLTAPAGSPSGSGYFTGAWQTGGHVYATSISASQCPGAASGPGGLGILDVSQPGSTTALTIAGTTNNYSNVVGSTGDRLLVLAQTQCPGSASLLWVVPSTGAAQTLLSAPAGQAGVTAAVPWGMGRTATAGG